MGKDRIEDTDCEGVGGPTHEAMIEGYNMAVHDAITSILANLSAQEIMDEMRELKKWAEWKWQESRK